MMKNQEDQWAEEEEEDRPIKVEEVKEETELI